MPGAASGFLDPIVMASSAAVKAGRDTGLAVCWTYGQTKCKIFAQDVGSENGIPLRVNLIQCIGRLIQDVT